MRVVRCAPVPILAFVLAGLAACGGDASEQAEPRQEGKPLSYWIEGLRDGSDRQRESVDALSRMGEDAVDPLIAVLRESDDTLQRIRAAGALGNIGAGLAWDGEGEPFDKLPVTDETVARILSALRAVEASGNGHLSGTAKSAVEQVEAAQPSELGK